MLKIFYNNGRDLFKELKEKKDSINKKYIIPFLLNFTNNIEEGTVDIIQVKEGSSGGMDIDSDFQSTGRERIFNYLVSKYSEDQVLYVGTYQTLGASSAAKDILRVYGVDYKQSNKFTNILQKELTWDENLENVKNNFNEQYSFYLEHKEKLDLVPDLLNKVRQTGRHAGGIVVLPSSVHNYIPVDRVRGETVTAFQESGNSTELDELGIVKYDILSVSLLDVIDETVNMIDEKLFLIEEEGIEKIVPESYIKGEVQELV